MSIFTQKPDQSCAEKKIKGKISKSISLSPSPFPTYQHELQGQSQWNLALTTQRFAAPTLHLLQVPIVKHLASQSVSLLSHNQYATLKRLGALSREVIHKLRRGVK